MDPLRKHPSYEREEAKIEPTRNDPTPHARQGDARFLPVVIISTVVLILLLIAGVVLVKGKGTKMIPHEQNNHPTSSIAHPSAPEVRYG